MMKVMVGISDLCFMFLLEVHNAPALVIMHFTHAQGLLDT